jgi:ABC-type microcin C transport system permease subunit YejB
MNSQDEAVADQIRNDWARAAYESANAAGRTATNSIVLVSGGAVVSLFTLIGTILSKHQAGAADRAHVLSVLTSVGWAIGFFGVSLVLGVLTAGMTYFSQLANAESLSRDDFNSATKYYRASNRLNYAAMVLGSLALVTMIAGAVDVLQMLAALIHMPDSSARNSK